MLQYPLELVVVVARTGVVVSKSYKLTVAPLIAVPVSS
jgi:hypothetical protein